MSLAKDARGYLIDAQERLAMFEHYTGADTHSKAVVALALGELAEVRERLDLLCVQHVSTTEELLAELTPDTSHRLSERG